MDTLREKLLCATLSATSQVFPKLAAHAALHIFTKPLRIAYPASEQPYLASATPLLFKNKFKGFSWGKPSMKRVLLLHGWNGRGTQLAAFSGPLVENGCQVFAFNGPGHFESAGSTLDPKIYADFMIALDQEYGPFEATIAHSFGAGVSVLAAHWGLRAKKQILVASPCEFEKVMRAYSDWVGLKTPSRAIFYRLMQERVGIAAEAMNVGLLGSNTPGVKAALILHDELDKEVSHSEAELMHSLWSRSTLKITRGLGHRKILKNPEIIQNVVDFIA